MRRFIGNFNGFHRANFLRVLARLRAHDLDPQSARNTVQLFDPHECSHNAEVLKTAFRNTFGERFQQVDTFG